MCDKCLDVANRIVDAIKNDRTERNIKRVLDRTCQNCPDQAGCKKFIDDNIDQLFELLRQDVTAAQICKALKLCGARLVHQSLVINKQGRAEVCDQCLQIATHIVNAIENNRTEENIKNTLDRACLLCPNRFGCKQWVNDNIDELYEMLREDVTPAQICELLRFCDGSEIPAALVANVENCGVCSMIVDYIIDELKDNSTDAAILDTFEKVCKVLPVDQQQCRNYIDVYGGYIVSLIEKKYAADAICAAIGLCETRKPVRQTPKTPKTICNECQLISGYLVSAVNDNHSEENIKAVVEKVCELIPMDVGQCQQFIDTNLDQLYQLLREEVTVDHICQTLRLCGTRVFPVPVRPEIKVKSCGLCSEVVDYLIGAIKDNSTDAEILDAVERVCKVLPFDKTECQNVINVYGGYIIDMIQRNVAADVICQKIGFCAPPPQRVVSDSCQLCRMISGFVISELKDNTTDAAILAALERGCSVLPIDQAQCRNVIDVYGSMIVSMVQRNLTPDDICGTLRLCAASRPRGQSCDLCETVANFLVDELKDNKTDAAILEALERVCSVLPVDKVSCQNTIDVYGKMIMDLIQKDASADQICAVIGLCSSQKVVERAKSDFCDACKMIAGFLVDELKDNKTDAAILAALEKVCKVVPVDNVQCKNYIDVYGDMVIEMIKNNLSPDEICSSIGYCSAKKVLALSDNQACPMCEIVVHVVEAELQNNNTQKEIRTALEKACSLLPENDAQQCRNMVNVYTAYIIDMVESLATAEQICQTLGFCPTPPSPPKCEVCLFITNFVESELSDNRTESQILKLLDKACDVIPNMDVPQCKETITQFSDMIITLLLQSVPPRKICEEIKMCPVSTKPVPAVSPVRGSLADKEQCTFCKWLVTWVDEKLYDNRTEAAIVDELDKACDLLTDAGKCKEMVNDYTDMIVKMLSQWADPEKICEAIKKCPSQKFTKDEPPCRYCRYVIDELRDHMHKTEDQLKKELDGICRVIPVDTSSCQAFMEKYAERIITMIMMDTDPEEICELLRVCPKKLKTTDSECSFCREVMRFVANEVKDETTDDEIIGFVSRACNFVPQPHREDCQRMVEIEGVVIVRMIGESLDANSICAALNYCPQARHPEKLTCTWCQYALHFIQEKLYDNSTQQMIREELEKMCSDLPKPELSNECKEFVDAYGPSLEVIIAQDLDPSIICPAIHACPSRGILPKPARRPSSQKCHDCVSTLRSFRHNPAQICKGVSSQFAGKCVGASSVGLRLVNAFESDYQICKYAKSCSKVSGSFRCNRGGCQHVR